jgi:hypothetical protein
VLFSPDGGNSPLLSEVEIECSRKDNPASIRQAGARADRSSLF